MELNKPSIGALRAPDSIDAERQLVNVALETLYESRSERKQCPLPSAWLSFSLGKRAWTGKEKQHIDHCSACQRYLTDWAMALGQPALPSLPVLIAWQAGLIPDDAPVLCGTGTSVSVLSGDIRLQAPWVKGLIHAVRSSQQAWEAVSLSIERVVRLIEGAGATQGFQTPLEDLLLVHQEGYASPSDQKISFHGFDRLDKYLIRRGERTLLKLEHPQLSPGTLIRLTLAPAKREESHSFLMLRDRYRGSGGAGELALSSSLTAGAVIAASPAEYEDFSEEELPTLESSYESAWHDDPTSNRFWKVWLEQLRVARPDLPPSVDDLLRRVQRDGARSQSLSKDVFMSTAIASALPATSFSLLHEGKTPQSAWRALQTIVGNASSDHQAELAWEYLRDKVEVASGPRAEAEQLYRLDADCRSAIHGNDKRTLYEAWNMANDSNLAKFASGYYKLAPQFQRLISARDVDSDRLVRAIKSSLAASLAILAARRSDAEEAAKWIAQTISSTSGQDVAPDQLPAVKGPFSEKRLIAWLGQMPSTWDAAIARDLVLGLLGRRRRPFRRLHVFAAAVVHDRGMQSCLHLELLRGGTHSFYPDPATMRLMPMTPDFLESLQHAWGLDEVRRCLGGGWDVRWSIAHELPVLSGTSIGGLMALGLWDLLTNTSDTRMLSLLDHSGPRSVADWSMTARVGERGALLPVEGVSQKVEQLLAQDVKLVFVAGEKNASEAHRAADPRHLGNCICKVDSVPVAITKLRVFYRPKRYLRNAKIVAATVALALLAARWTDSSPRDNDAKAPDVGLTVAPFTDEPTPAPLSASGTVAVLLDAARPGELVEGVDYGVFYNDRRTADRQFAFLQSPAGRSWNLFYNVREPGSYAGFWCKIRYGDWSSFVDGELVVRCHRIGPSPAAPAVFDDHKQLLEQTECAPICKVEIKLDRKQNGSAEPVKDSLIREIPIAEGGEIRIPLVDFHLLSGHLDGKEVQKANVSEVCIVFENRNLYELKPPPLTSNFALQAIALTKQRGEEIEDISEFVVDRSAISTGYMGDLGEETDVTPDGRRLNALRHASAEEGATRFTYVVTGKGPHYWDMRYIDGKLNTKPANFAGVAYLANVNDWGDKPGKDLRALRPKRIQWQARKLTSGPCPVNFFIGGGGEFLWDEKTGQKRPTPYPDSLARLELRNPPLTEEFQTFEEELSFKPNDPRLSNVICLFGWTIIDPSQDKKVYEFELKEIRYLSK